MAATRGDWGGAGKRRARRMRIAAQPLRPRGMTCPGGPSSRGGAANAPGGSEVTAGAWRGEEAGGRSVRGKQTGGGQGEVRGGGGGGGGGLEAWDRGGMGRRVPAGAGEWPQSQLRWAGGGGSGRGPVGESPPPRAGCSRLGRSGEQRPPCPLPLGREIPRRRPRCHSGAGTHGAVPPCGLLASQPRGLSGPWPAWGAGCSPTGSPWPPVPGAARAGRPRGGGLFSLPSD